MPVSRVFAAFLIALSFCVTGCSTSIFPVTAAANVAVGGNWQFASTDAAASRLPLLSGELSGTSAAMTGMLHSHGAGDCVAPTTGIAVTGAADVNRMVTLTGAGVAGGTLRITGTLATDGRSLDGAAYTVTGGSCAFAAQAAAVAQAYSSITGMYTGGFSDANGQVVNITANLTQTPSSNPNGDFSLSGTATFQNTCFVNPVTISNSLVTGGSFTLTYADTSTQNSVTASGTFSPDGTMLSVTNWMLTGTCGPDSGTGGLIRH